MLRLPAAHLPPAVTNASEHVVIEQDDVQVVVPALDAATVDTICTDLLQSRARLATVPVERIIRAIDAAARALLDPAEPEREHVLRSLHAVSGFSAPMAMRVLDRVAQDWLAPELDALVRDELGGNAAVESFVRTPGGRRVRAVAPRLGLHVFAGNVPGVGVTSIVRALLVRSAVFAKSAAAEPVLAPAFCRLLARMDAEIAACVAVTYWRGGDVPLEDAAMRRADLVVHYGGAEAIATLRARAPAHVRFIEHGPRISFAVIDATADAALDGFARDLATATALFDQQGCVSPQLAYVIGSAGQARALAATTAAALADIQQTLPRGRIDAAEAAAIREMRTRAEFRAITGDGELWTGQDLDFSVILSDDPAFEGSCLNRTLLVKHVPDLAALLHVVAPFGTLLQTVGLAGFAPERRLHTAIALADAGATRITSIAEMAWPPTGWHHDGRGPLRELIQWAELEGL